jgi:hypothetical protein
MDLKTASLKMQKGEKVYWVDDEHGLSCGFISEITISQSNGSIAHLVDCVWLQNSNTFNDYEVANINIADLNTKKTILTDYAIPGNNTLEYEQEKQNEEDRINKLQTNIDSIKELQAIKEKLWEKKYN